MMTLGDIDEAKDTVWRDAVAVLARLQTLTSDRPTIASDAIPLLMQIREETAEEINQVQHEQLILGVAEGLIGQGIVPTNTVWEWNPRQTGTADEPDLRGSAAGEIVASAEVTTSLEPKGLIDTRMRETVNKLSRMPGYRVYGVRTEAMAMRARTKIRKNEYEIAVHQVAV